MDFSEDEENETSTPEELKEIANSLSLLPEKSKQIYEHKFNQFNSWCIEKKVTRISENVLLAYFSELSKNMSPSTVWSTYSMLKSTIKIKNDIDISRFKKVIAFLKKNAVGYVPKKSKILSKSEVEQFLKKAPNHFFLMKKVVLIIGISGACRRDELTQMRVEDIDDKGDVLIIKILKSKNYKSRTFTITNDNESDIDYLQLFRDYLKLRPVNIASTGRLFLNFRNGLCTRQPVGSNTIGKIPSDVATFLKLADPQLYTGHCFRRTSATLLVEAGGDILQLKRHGGWKSSTVAEGYVEESITSKITTATMILGQNSHVNTNKPHPTSAIQQTATSTTQSHTGTESQHSQEVSSATAGIVINNCTSCTFNISITNNK